MLTRAFSLTIILMLSYLIGDFAAADADFSHLERIGLGLIAYIMCATINSTNGSK